MGMHFPQVRGNIPFHSHFTGGFCRVPFSSYLDGAVPRTVTIAKPRNRLSTDERNWFRYSYN